MSDPMRRVPQGQEVPAPRRRWQDGPSVVLRRVLLGIAGALVAVVAVVSGAPSAAGAATINRASLAGSYSGDYFVGGSAGGLTYYVAPGGTAIEDVSANVGMTCSPGGRSAGGWLVIDSLPLAANGTFAATTSADR